MLSITNLRLDIMVILKGHWGNDMRGSDFTTTLTRFKVSSSLGKILILQVTGMLTAATRLVRILRILSGCERRAAPMPPFRENDLGQPKFNQSTLGSKIEPKSKLKELRRKKQTLEYFLFVLIYPCSRQ